ncbi:hypothetical protein ACXZ65_12585 [Streptomyces aculeolatus]
MTVPEEGGGDRVVNTVSGGAQFGPLPQGRNFTVHLPPRITPAPAGLPEGMARALGPDHTDVEAVRAHHAHWVARAAASPQR